MSQANQKVMIGYYYQVMRSQRYKIQGQSQAQRYLPFVANAHFNKIHIEISYHVHTSPNVIVRAYVKLIRVSYWLTKILY